MINHFPTLPVKTCSNRSIQFMNAAGIPLNQRAVAKETVTANLAVTTVLIAHSGYQLSTFDNQLTTQRQGDDRVGIAVAKNLTRH